MRRSRLHIMLGLVALSALSVAGGCASRVTRSTSSSPSPAGGPEARTPKELIRVAVRFNEDYAANKAGLVYDRWDARSRAVISRAAYVRRHLECLTAPGPAEVEGAEPAAGGYWTVNYSISGIQFTDYWRYENRRWLFDLLRSNPDAVKLYRLPFAAYEKAVGCAPGR